jgi:hypothetical protein
MYDSPHTTNHPIQASLDPIWHRSQPTHGMPTPAPAKPTRRRLSQLKTMSHLRHTFLNEFNPSPPPTDDVALATPSAAKPATASYPRLVPASRACPAPSAVLATRKSVRIRTHSVAAPKNQFGSELTPWPPPKISSGPNSLRGRPQKSVRVRTHSVAAPKSQFGSELTPQPPQKVSSDPNSLLSGGRPPALAHADHHAR